MEKTKEIHKALNRRKFINSEINNLKEAIERLTRIMNTFEDEKKILNFELHTWDKFSSENET